ncbi:MAG: VCBS repeat-containing protein [Anaerolineae bacterium]|nr:VCBS repeat-containing protein [Anaerolineae bacterium]
MKSQNRVFLLLLSLFLPICSIFLLFFQTVFSSNENTQYSGNLIDSDFKVSSIETDWFYSYQVFSDIRYATTVAVGNFNGDALPDIVAAGCFITCTLNVLLQSGNSELIDSGTTYTYTNGGSDQLLVADLNNDSLDDIAVLQQFTDPESIKLFLQNSGTTFSEYILTTDGHQADAITAGDFNNDQLTDLAASFFGESIMGVFLQNNFNAFQAPIYYSTLNRGFHDMATGDFNNDGLVDIVQTHGEYGFLGSSVTVFQQNNMGSLNSAVHYDIDQTQDYYVNSVSVGDVNNDGLDDILVQSTRGLTIFEQGAIGLPTIPTYYQGYCNPSDIEINDINLDGLNDVLTLGDGCGELALFEQESTNSLSSYETYTIGNSGGSFTNSGLAVDDINNDGKPDAIVAARGDGLAILYHSDPDFAIGIEPQTIHTTFGTDTITFTLVISRLYNFTDTVSLNFIEFPNGVNHNLSSDPFGVPSTLQFSLTSVSSLAPTFDPYVFEIVGVSGGITHSKAANFTILHRTFIPFIRN